MGQFIAMLGAAAPLATAAEIAMASSLGVGIAGTTAAGGLAASTGFLGLSSGAWSGISTAGSMLSGIASGNQQAAAYKQQAQQEEFAAKDREVSRRKRLIASLASQNAIRGASGVRAFEGSPAAMMRTDIKEFDYDQSMGAANLAMSTSSLLESGKYAQQSGYMSAGTSLLEYGSKRAKRG
jgi:hypothetical protein